MRDLQTPTTSAGSSTSLASKTFMLLALSTAVASGGAYVGLGLHQPGLIIGCVIAELVGLFILWMVREQTALGIAVLTGWMAISGITAGVAVQPYLEILGPQTVTAAFLGTTGVMAICGTVACFSGINFEPLQKGLIIALLVLIGIGIVNWFVHFGPVVNLIYAGGGMLVFGGFFLVDFYRMSQSRDNSWSAAIWVTLAIYLDFINFFLYLLKFLVALRGNDD